MPATKHYYRGDRSIGIKEVIKKYSISKEDFFDKIKQGEVAPLPYLVRGFKEPLRFDALEIEALFKSK